MYGSTLNKFGFDMKDCLSQSQHGWVQKYSPFDNHLKLYHYSIENIRSLSLILIGVLTPCFCTLKMCQHALNNWKLCYMVQVDITNHPYNYSSNHSCISHSQTLKIIGFVTMFFCMWNEKVGYFVKSLVFYIIFSTTLLL